SAERTSVIDSTETPMALKNPRSGRPGPISMTRVARSVRACMLLRQRTVPLICRTSRLRSAVRSASWNPPVRFDVTHGALAASQTYGHRFLHAAAALADDADRVAERDHAGGHQGGVLAEAVAAEAPSGEPERLRQPAQHRDLRDEDRRLCVLGEREPVVGREG